jgi:hypothetical protein
MAQQLGSEGLRFSKRAFVESSSDALDFRVAGRAATEPLEAFTSAIVGRSPMMRFITDWA